MGKSATFDNQLLLLIFNGTNIPNIANNATTAPLTSLYAALHSEDPTATGNQANNEVTYTSYQRVAVARTPSGFTVSGNVVSPASNIMFPIGTGGSGSATFWSVGVASTGASTILYSGPISPAISLGVGVMPTLTTASTITES